MIDWSALFAPGTPVAALPAWRAPRLFVAAEGQRWARTALYPASRPPARLVRLAARLAHGAHLAPTRVAAGPGNVAPRFGRVVAVLPGTHGPTRKATLALADDTGRIAAFAKLAALPAARDRVRHEHVMLGVLDRTMAPVALGLVEAADHTILVIGALPGRPVSWTAPPEAALRAAVEHLHHGPERTADEHPWLVAAAREAGASWPERLAGRGWPAAYRHGDLTGGHVLLADDGTVRLVDWEYGAIAGFPWVDLAHFVLQAEGLVRRTTPERGRARAIGALTRAPWPGLGPSEADAIVRLAAFAAYRDARADGHADDAPLQAWRHAVWSG